MKLDNNIQIIQSKFYREILDKILSLMNLHS